MRKQQQSGQQQQQGNFSGGRWWDNIRILNNNIFIKYKKIGCYLSN
jgi:hypothetical protein